MQQDGHKTHVVKPVLDYLNKKNIKTLSWPAKSPDLNIIEDVWNLNKRLQLEDLINHIKLYKNIQKMTICY